MTKRAQACEAMFDEVVAALRARIKSGDATAADLNVARSILHDAGISLSSGGPTSPTGQLKKALEELDAEEDTFTAIN